MLNLSYRIDNNTNRANSDTVKPRSRLIVVLYYYLNTGRYVLYSVRNREIEDDDDLVDITSVIDNTIYSRFGNIPRTQ